MFRFLLSLVTLALIGFTAFVCYEKQDELINYAHSFKKESTIYTLETQFSPEEISTLHQKTLLKDSNCSIAKTSTLFLPHLLLDVKYVNQQKNTEEGRVLFSLVSGEMILDTKTFETTHGFEDCLIAQATEEDFRLLHLLEQQGGYMAREELARRLSLDAEDLSFRLDGLRKKHLIAVKGDTVRIHFHNSRLNIVPQTKMAQPIVMKQVEPAQQLSSRYSKEKIRKIVKAAFGQDFALRKEIELFIPVIEIQVSMKDGSIHTTYWSGLTGKQIDITQ